MSARLYLLSSLRDLSAHRGPLVPIFQISPDFVPHYEQSSDRMEGSVSTCPSNSSGQTAGFFEFMFLSPYPTWHLIIFGLLASTVGLVTIGGNLVVILSFVVVPSIRQPTNYFIASLAVSDLLIGVVSMPFYTVYLLFGEVWPLGENLCDLWLSVDYTLCMCSIYTVFCITVDRFCSVKLPAKYRKWRTGRKVGIAICLTWTIPILVFFTSIFGWQHFVGKRTVPPLKCYVQYMEDALFNSLLQIGYFWITLSAMIALYVGIYKVALDLHKRSSEKRDKNMACLVSMAGKTVSQIGTVITMGYRANDQKQPPQYLDSPDYYNIVYNPSKDVPNDLKPISDFPELQNPINQLINAKRPSRISLAAFSTTCKNEDPNCSLVNQADDQHIDSRQVTPNSQVIQFSSSVGYHSPREMLCDCPVSNKDDGKDYFKDTDDKEILLSPPRAKDMTKPCIVITNEAAEVTGGDAQNLDHVVLYTPDSNRVTLPNGTDARFTKCYSSQYNFQGSMCRFYPSMRPHSSTEIFVRPVTEELNADVLNFGKPISRKGHRNHYEVCNIDCLKNSRNEDCMTRSYTRAKDSYGSFNEGTREVKMFARLSTVNLNTMTTCYRNRKHELIENYLNGVGSLSNSQDFEGTRLQKDLFAARERLSPNESLNPLDSQRASSQILINNDRSPCCQCAGNDCGNPGAEDDVTKPETTSENPEASMASGFFNFVNLPNPSSFHLLSPLKQHIASAYSGLNFPQIFGFVPHNSSAFSATLEHALQKKNLDTVDHLQAKTGVSHQALSSSKQSIAQNSISEEKGFSRSRFSSYFDFMKPASAFISKFFDRTPSDDGSKSVVIENPHISDELEPGWWESVDLACNFKTCDWLETN